MQIQLKENKVTVKNNRMVEKLVLFANSRENNILGFKDKVLAELLDITSGNFATMKRRESVPFEKIIKYATKEGFDLNYIFKDVYFIHL